MRTGILIALLTHAPTLLAFAPAPLPHVPLSRPPRAPAVTCAVPPPAEVAPALDALDALLLSPLLVPVVAAFSAGSSPAARAAEKEELKAKIAENERKLSGPSGIFSRSIADQTDALEREVSRINKKMAQGSPSVKTSEFRAKQAAAEKEAKQRELAARKQAAALKQELKALEIQEKKALKELEIAKAERASIAAEVEAEEAAAAAAAAEAYEEAEEEEAPAPTTSGGKDAKAVAKAKDAAFLLGAVALTLAESAGVTAPTPQKSGGYKPRKPAAKPGKRVRGAGSTGGGSGGGSGWMY